MKTIITLTICMLFAASSFAASTRVDSDLNVNGTIYVKNSPLAAPDKLLKNQGAWDVKTLYSVGDVVNSFGSTYICTNINTESKPPNDKFWSLLGQEVPTKSCGAGQFMRGFNADGSLSCGYLPVIASNLFDPSGSGILITATINSILSVTITAPEAGVITVESANWFRHVHTLGSSETVYTVIESAANVASTDGQLINKVSDTAQSDNYYSSLTNIKTFPVAAGTHTYHLNAYTFQNPSKTAYFGGRIQATWYPN